MMVAEVNRRTNKAIPYLVAIAISSLATTWVLKTPEISKKAEQVPVLQQQVVKAKDDAKVSKALVDCEKWRAAVATALADEAVYDHLSKADLSLIPENCRPAPKAKATGAPPRKPSP